MLPNFKWLTSRQCQSNSFRMVVANIAIFLPSLTSLCFGQVVASSQSYSTNSGGNESERMFRHAQFPLGVDADIVLGGLFPVHSKNVTESGPPKCGSLNAERGIHRLEAMIFAVDQINKNPDLLPNITLGMSAYDTCGWYTRALEESLEFVMKSMENKAVPTSCESELKENKIVGVVGAASSAVSVQVANLLRLFNLPQISYASTTPDLSDKSKYDFFVRTVPPDNYQARAMVDVVRALKWTSVFTVYSEGIYGERGIREFTAGAKTANICIARSAKIEAASSNEQINLIIAEFLKHSNVHGVILFCTDSDARRLLEGAQRKKGAGQFAWVASDYWGTRKKPIEGLEQYAEGAITISLTEAHFPAFKKHFTSLKPENRSKVNPWFKEFWETQFDCSLDKNKNSNRSCPKDAALSQDVRFDDIVPFVIDAVYAFVHCLDKMYKRLCPAQEGICPEMKESFKGKELRDLLFNVTFTGVTGPVSFDKNGNGPGRYDIYRLEGGKYTKVASWNERLYDAKKLYDKKRNGSILSSHCGSPCPAGSYKMFDEGSCCWSCKTCQENHYVEDDTSCRPCQQGQRPNSKMDGCEPLPRRYIPMSWLIMVMVFAGLGIMCTIFTGTLFYVNKETPLVKAAGRELTCALLFGLLSCYVFSFFLLAEPSTTICAIQRFGLGFSFCVCYAAILIRTNRIARIFEKSNRSTKPPLFIKPASQIAILAVFIGIDVGFAGIGLAKWPPKTVLAYPTNKDVLLICNIQSYDLVFALTYNVVIIILCTIYAFRTRKTPANFNEARYIGFAMYTTCIIWVAFLPVQIGVNKDYATITLSINTTLNATTLLLCIFGPKVYIMVFKPSGNLRSKSLNSWRSQDTECPDTQGRNNSESQVTELSMKSTPSDLGIDNPTLQNGHTQTEAAL